MDEQIRNLLKDLPGTSHGQALKQYLAEKYTELDSVQDCKSWDEAIGKQYALKLIDQIFGFMKSDTPNKKGKNPYL